jgi:DNA-binding MarR family transcriptional regulator
MNINDNLAIDVCLHIAKAHAALSRRFDTTLGGLHGISFSDFQLLHQLNRATGNRLRRVDLAERLGLTASGVTRSLLPLEKIGLVARQADARDARVGYAVLTATGKRLLIDASETARTTAQELLKDASTARLEAMSSMLMQIAGPY